MADTKKEGFFARIGRWAREMKSELKKVVWPTKKQVVKNTLIVIACAVIVAIVVWLFDLAGTGIYNGLTTLANLIRGGV